MPNSCLTYFLAIFDVLVAMSMSMIDDISMRYEEVCRKSLAPDHCTCEESAVATSLQPSSASNFSDYRFSALADENAISGERRSRFELLDSRVLELVSGPVP